MSLTNEQAKARLIRALNNMRQIFKECGIVIIVVEPSEKDSSIGCFHFNSNIEPVRLPEILQAFFQNAVENANKQIANNGTH